MKRFIPAFFLLFCAAQYLYAVPETINDLTAVKGTQVKLTWTAPDDGEGVACEAYLLKYSTYQLTNDAQFDLATEYQQQWVPQDPGNEEVKLLTGFLPDMQYYFFLRSSDGSEWSAISSTGTNYTVSYIVWSSDVTDATCGIALGDYDGDGDLDQLIGNQSEVNRVYRNEGDGTFTIAWSSEETDGTLSVAWGDYDNDTDLDIFVGNNWEANRVYKNNGDSTFTLVWT